MVTIAQIDITNILLAPFKIYSKILFHAAKIPVQKHANDNLYGIVSLSPSHISKNISEKKNIHIDNGRIRKNLLRLNLQIF